MNYTNGNERLEYNQLCMLWNINSYVWSISPLDLVTVNEIMMYTPGVCLQFKQGISIAVNKEQE